TFDVLDVPATAPGSGKPTATVVDPAPNGGSVDLSQTHNYFDVIYAAPPGGTLDYASILGNYQKLTISGSGITLRGILQQINPISAVTTDGGVEYYELILDRTNHQVTRNGIVILKQADLPKDANGNPISDDDLFLTAIRMTGTTRFRYYLDQPVW